MTDIVERIRQEVKDWRCGPVVAEAADEIERLRRLLQWCEVRLPEQYRAGLRRMIENPVEPDHTPIVHS